MLQFLTPVPASSRHWEAVVGWLAILWETWIVFPAPAIDLGPAVTLEAFEG